ncbi:MAG: hypothetical protein L6R41_005087 [Letrouitia leprolyta]|nr:MAG: hypothetical protein L6R41_005087 [Letrouitia leprolyta]
MTSTVRSERSKLWRARSTTSSLAGMEKPYTPKEISPFEIYQDPVDLYIDQAQLDKPLPPTPRKPSSVYSVQRDEEQQAPSHRVRNDILPSSTFLAATTYRSSTSRLPDPKPARPQLIRQAQTHAVSDPVLRSNRVKEERPDPTAHIARLQQELKFGSLSISGAQNLPTERVTSVWVDDALEHANNYKSVFHTKSSLPPSTTNKRHYDNHQRASSPMSGRITDVVDQSLVPAPLQLNSFEESERPPSRFSSSSSDVGAHHIRDSLRGIARKALHMRKESKDTDETDWATFTRFQEKASLMPRRQSRIGSFVGQRRESFQQSICGMYDTLTGLGTPTRSPKPTPVTTSGPFKPHKPRVKSPAIPLSPYQEMGPKAWETASKSSRKTTRSSKARLEGASQVAFSLQDEKSRIRFSTPAYGTPSSHEKEQKQRSMATKLASAFSSGAVQVESAVGLNTTRVKRTRSEKKREELKRKIKVIGLREPTANKTEGPWL